MQQDLKTSGLYDRDFYSWSRQQAEALRLRDFHAIDWDNLIEEIEDLGKAARSNWEAFCSRVIEHMLKIEHCREAADQDLKHWMREVLNFRRQTAKLIEENPGLKGSYPEMLAGTWKYGRDYACQRLAEYDKDNNPQTTWKKALRERSRALPAQCPYRLEDLTAFDPRRDRMPRADLWPPSVARVLNARIDAGLSVR